MDTSLPIPDFKVIQQCFVLVLRCKARIGQITFNMSINSGLEILVILLMLLIIYLF